MSLAAKRYAKKGIYITVGIVFILLSIILFYMAFSTKRSLYGAERMERKYGLVGGIFCLVIGIGSVGYGSTGIKSYDKDTLKLTGQQLNHKPEAVAEIENFKN